MGLRRVSCWSEFFPFKSGPARPGREREDEAYPGRPAARAAGRSVVVGGTKARLLDGAEIRRSVTRIAHEILERNKGAGEVAPVGIANRGDDLARRLAAEIERIGGPQAPVGALDTPVDRADIGV